jgi:quinol monooxygenase YgiN
MAGVRLLAQFKLKPGSEREFHAAWLDRMKSVRTEPGCLQYELFASMDDPCAIAMAEAWESVAAFRAHTLLDASRNARPTDPLPGGEYVAAEPFTVEINWDMTLYDYDPSGDTFVPHA